MTPREIFLRSLRREPTPRPATGSATSIVTVDLMEKVGVFFPEAHLDPREDGRPGRRRPHRTRLRLRRPALQRVARVGGAGLRGGLGRAGRMPACRKPPYGLATRSSFPRPAGPPHASHRARGDPPAAAALPATSPSSAKSSAPGRWATTCSASRSSSINTLLDPDA